MGGEPGEFTPVYVNDSLTVDFADREQFERYHLCFRVTDTDFDAIFARIQRAGAHVPERPRGDDDMQINRRLGGKNVSLAGRGRAPLGDAHRQLRAGRLAAAGREPRVLTSWPASTRRT